MCRTGHGNISLFCDKMVPKESKRLLREASDYAKDNLGIEHAVVVLAYSRGWLELQDGRSIWGCFHAEWDALVLTVAAGFSRHPADAVETLFHEICHYEQFRDRKLVCERGVASRSRSLTRKFYEKTQPFSARPIRFYSER